MSSKKKNNTAKKDREKAEEEMVEAAFRSMDLEKSLANRDGIDAVYAQHGVEGLPGRASDLESDDPPCDYCGKEESGTKQCSQCKLVFYCSKECQAAAWKFGGHKKECKIMKEKSEMVSKEVVDCLTNKGLPLHERVDRLQELDGSGIYKEARNKHGLNEALQGIFQEEKEQVLARFRAGLTMSHTQWIMSTLFRGGRCEGHQMGRGAFREIDGYRCKSYVKSHPDAFQDWFQASLAVITSFLDPVIARDEGLRVRAMRISRDVVAAWSLVFTNRKVAKAILLGESRRPDEAAQDRAAWIAKTIKASLVKLWNAREGMDVGGSIEGHLNQVSAMVMLRLEEFQVLVEGTPHDRAKFIKLLGLGNDPRKRAMFTKTAMPLADHTMRKGGAPTNEEALMILRGQRLEF